MKALLLIDIQNDYFPGGKFPLSGMNKAARQAARLADEFRRDNNPVIHIRHENLRADAKFFLPGTGGAEINSLVMPHPGEKIYLKNHPNSFWGTGLDEDLKTLGVDTLHLAGAMTNMCVDSTARAAFDLGYSVFIHKRCCAAPAVLGTKLIHWLFLKNLGSAFARIV